MAAITNSYNDGLVYDGAVRQVNDIDERVNAIYLDLQERLINGGHRIPSSALASSGIHAVSGSNYVANEFSIYNSTLATKLLRLTDILAEWNIADMTLSGDMAITGSLTVGGNPVLDAGTNERVIVLSVFGLTGADVELPTFVIPQGLTGTIIELVIMRASGTGATHTFMLEKTGAANWVGDQFTATPYLGSDTMASVLTINIGSYGARTTVFSVAGVVAGDVFTIDERSGAGAVSITAHLVIQLDW